MVSPLCDMTVTVYRGGTRYTHDGCFYTGRYSGREDICGTHLRGKFTLVSPPDFPVEVGDRVLPGDGPQTAPEWAGRVAWVQPMYICGTLHHYESGN